MTRPPFEILGSLGAGGMAEVFRAREVESGREVALKIARHGDPSRLERFRREGQVTAALRHPGIVVVHSAGELEGRPYLAYELIEGARPLAEAWEHTTRERRVQLVLETCQAVAHAHAQGVVHRDLKSDNVLVDADGQVKVADFGLASVSGLSEAERLTETGAFLGTPYCMAPEQVRSEPITPATDVWALGVLLYQALTDRLPFHGDTMAEQMVQILGGELTTPRALDPSVPPPLDAVTVRALSRPVARRFPDAGALAAAIEDALQGQAPQRATPAWALAAAATSVLVVCLIALAARLAGTEQVPPGGDPAEPRPDEKTLASAEKPPLAAPSLAELLPPATPKEPLHLREQRRLALQGDGLALAQLGRMYARGRYGAKVDVPVARRLLEAAAKRGYPEAWTYLGDLFVERDIETALDYYGRGAAKGLARSMTRLGSLYFHGKHVPWDPVLASKWYQRAARRSDPEGLHQLAMMYWSGTGVLQDRKQAVRFWERAAAEKHAAAMFELGKRLQSGDAVGQDGKRARALLEQAAQKGNPNAMRLLAENLRRSDRAQAIALHRRALARQTTWRNLEGLADTLSTPPFVRSEVLEAAFLYARAARKGEPKAMRGLARLRVQGWTFTGDPQRAGPDARAGWQAKRLPLRDLTPELLVRWYTVAAKQFPAGRVALALAKQHGFGTARDRRGAHALLDKASRAGHPRAMFWLACTLWDGLSHLGVRKRAAIGWHRRAAERGDRNALLRLGQFQLGWHGAAALGVLVDGRAARGALQRAASKGHPRAVRMLDRLKKKPR